MQDSLAAHIEHGHAHARNEVRNETNEEDRTNGRVQLVSIGLLDSHIANTTGDGCDEEPTNEAGKPGHVRNGGNAARITRNEEEGLPGAGTETGATVSMKH